MFGYVTASVADLSDEQKARYRGYYCGLCKAIKRRYGATGRLMLSYDMTFLYILLSSLYEPKNVEATERCALHPIKPHGYIFNDIATYCADMNAILAYHKCQDDWADDRSVAGWLQKKHLQSGYEKLLTQYPETCKVVETCMADISKLEKETSQNVDLLANLTALMLGSIYAYKQDLWKETLVEMGQGLGRFVYLMDAYDDLPADRKKKRFNPLYQLSKQDGYESVIKEGLAVCIGECTEAFEQLPLVEDMDILRNILYSGCWLRYEHIARRAEAKPFETKEAGS